MKLEIKDLHAGIEKKDIIKGVNLTVKEGEAHVIMGPNGSGKTTLAKAVFGYPGIKVSKGDILADGRSILPLKTDARAQLGLFLGFQHPVEIEGVGFVNFLRASREAVSQGQTSMKELMKDIKLLSSGLKMDDSIIGRALNKGLSGGEKKKAEILQMALQKPKIAILDEPDSGLDIDAVKIVASNINKVVEETRMGLLVITHYNRILSYMHPEHVHVMMDGRIVADGGNELIDRIEKEGYESFGR